MSVNKSRFVMRVEAVRKVRTPAYGSEAYVRDSIDVEIPFGKGCDVKTGREAYAIALGKAKSVISHASEVSVARLNGGSGGVEILKNDPNAYFEKRWEDAGVRFC